MQITCFAHRQGRIFTALHVGENVPKWTKTPLQYCDFPKSEGITKIGENVLKTEVEKIFNIFGWKL